MKFKDLARAKLDSLISTPHRSTSVILPINPFDTYVDLINEELKNENLSPLIDFVLEYHGSFECFYGYLFEPYPGLPELLPLAKKTKKPYSPYFCAKLPVKDLGSVFLIPLSNKATRNFALIVRPERLFRQPIRVDQTVTVYTSTLLVSPPYSTLMSVLTSWAVCKEASRLKIK
jgi:hypothetical protein